MMETKNNDFESQAAQLERVFRGGTADERKAAPPVNKRAYRAKPRRFENPDQPKFSSICCGLIAGTLMFNTFVPQAFALASFESSRFTAMFTGPDPHTIEGTAAIHKSMQSGTVNVSKSTITGIVDSESMTASLYWTFVLKNNNSSDKEAAITMELPKNSALSRATLWINGVAQEAAFSSNTQVQNAYDSIVVRHRDPLLVTQIGPNKIKILAAPVTANGGEMQFRIGITAPAEKGEDGRSFVRMPSILESNLKFDSKQDIHLTSETPISGVGTTDESGIFVLKANVPSDEMSKIKINLGKSSEKTFATRLTHTNPPEYLQAVLVDGKLQLTRVKDKPSCKIINDDDVAFRLSNVWAHKEIESLAAKGDVNGACNIANVYRIVSSVSGATVLEVDSDYSNNGLNRDMYRTLGRSASSGDNFTEAVGFVPYSANPSSGDAFQSNAPMLQGATTGTIGPQGSDATVIMGVNTAGTIRVNNLANLEALLNILSNITQAIGIALAAYMLAESALNDGLKAPIRLSRVRTFWLALSIGTIAFLTPSGVNMLIACLRDLNLYY